MSIQQTYQLGAVAGSNPEQAISCAGREDNGKCALPRTGKRGERAARDGTVQATYKVLVSGFIAVSLWLSVLVPAASAAALVRPVTAGGPWLVPPVIGAILSPEEARWLVVGVTVILTLLGGAVAVTAFLKNLRDLREVKAPPQPAPQPFVITMKEQFVEKSAFEELKQDVHNRIKEMSSYLHDGIHGVKEQLQALTIAGEDREERLAEKLDEHWKTLNKERSASTARLHDRLEATNQTMRADSDAKFKDIRHEINEIPTRLISILRDTNAIGNRQ